MMKRIVLNYVIAGTILTGLALIFTIVHSPNAFAIVQGSCANMNYLWDHTYDHSRLKELKPECVILKGTLGKPETGEGDGDIHFDVKPDKGYEDLLNSHNTKGMVIEIICWDKPNQSYNQKWGNYCQGVDSRSHYPSLNEGDHVQVTGKWVQDIGHAGQVTHAPWNEIHPVEKIDMLH